MRQANQMQRGSRKTKCAKNKKKKRRAREKVKEAGGVKSAVVWKRK